MSRPRGRAWAAVAALWTAATWGGCAADPTAGYSAASTFGPAIDTVAVEVFENETFEREIGFLLTEAVIKEIEARTPYQVTRSRRADTILTGRIVSVDRERLSKSPTTGLSEEFALSVTVDFVWKATRTGRILVERRALTADGVIHPSRPLGEPIEIAQYAAVEEMARGIVSAMRSNW